MKSQVVFDITRMFIEVTFTQNDCTFTAKWIVERENRCSTSNHQPQTRTLNSAKPEGSNITCMIPVAKREQTTIFKNYRRAHTIFTSNNAIIEPYNQTSNIPSSQKSIVIIWHTGSTTAISNSPQCPPCL